MAVAPLSPQLVDSAITMLGQQIPHTPTIRHSTGPINVIRVIARHVEPVFADSAHILEQATRQVR